MLMRTRTPPGELFPLPNMARDKAERYAIGFVLLLRLLRIAIEKSIFFPKKY